MTVATLLAIGLLTGLTTVLFGFGGGFVTVPVILWLDAAAGPAAPVVAVATSSVVMIVNAAVATAATPRDALARLGSSRTLLVLLALGGALGALAANLAPHRLITWGFIAYLALTIVDVLLRPGFLGPGRPATAREGAAIPTGWGLGIGSLASFLGVGGSVMTVPMLRRSGLPMQLAATLANPLTLCISIPAGLVFLVTAGALPGLRIGPNDGPLAGSGDRTVHRGRGRRGRRGPAPDRRRPGGDRAAAPPAPHPRPAARLGLRGPPGRRAQRSGGRRVVSRPAEKSRITQSCRHRSQPTRGNAAARADECACFDFRARRQAEPTARAVSPGVPGRRRRRADGRHR